MRGVGWALLLVLTACGGVDGQPVRDPAALADASWEGRVEVDAESGDLTIPGFNEHIDAEQPAWATDPARTAATALQLGRSRDDAGPVVLDVDRSDEHPRVRVTFTDLADDSVAAVRYELTLREGEDGLYRLADGQRTQRCRHGRGPEGFGPRPCA